MPTSKFKEDGQKSASGAAEGGERKSQVSKISKKSMVSKKKEIEYEESSPCSDDESRGEN